MLLALNNNDYIMLIAKELLLKTKYAIIYHQNFPNLSLKLRLLCAKGDQLSWLLIVVADMLFICYSLLSHLK